MHHVQSKYVCFHWFSRVFQAALRRLRVNLAISSRFLALEDVWIGQAEIKRLKEVLEVGIAMNLDANGCAFGCNREDSW